MEGLSKWFDDHNGEVNREDNPLLKYVEFVMTDATEAPIFKEDFNTSIKFINKCKGIIGDKQADIRAMKVDVDKLKSDIQWLSSKRYKTLRTVYKAGQALSLVSTILRLITMFIP